MDPISAAIGLGLAVTLLFSELFGLAAGGMVVPGYIALCLNDPMCVALTLLAAWLTYVVVRAISGKVILYGRRRIVLMILVGFLIGALIRALPIGDAAVWAGMAGVAATGVAVVGFIIPGLIAIWIDRQGLVETVSVLLMTSVVVRLVLILFQVDAIA
ncbi:MAG: poly-gamma-glutamate biosynthesis protein PgsC [Pirellulales bacterium]|nr:poly-gamma-glutamate biosynthesis protein PgsC [Pirellulales bacterium]